eukprot:m.14536 g.14536  ORF g.14536 m.14536 type:complete len:395 (-) comp7155_c0_seq1:44-1228(-)
MTTLRVLGHTRGLGDEVVDGGVAQVVVDHGEAKGVVAEDGLGAVVPGLAAVGGLQEPGAGGDGRELATDSPDVVGVDVADLHEGVLLLLRLGHEERAVPRLAAVGGAVDAGTASRDAGGLADSTAVVGVVGSAVNAVEVEAAVVGKDGLPGLAAVSGLADLGEPAGVADGLRLVVGLVATQLAAGVVEEGLTQRLLHAVSAGPLAGSDVPGGVRGEGGIAGQGEEAGVEGDKGLAAVLRHSHTLHLAKLVGAGAAKLLAAVAVSAEVADVLRLSAALGRVEAGAIVHRVELAKDRRDDNRLDGSVDVEEEQVGAEVGLAVVPVDAAVGCLQDERADAVGITAHKAFGGAGEGNTDDVRGQGAVDDVPRGGCTDSPGEAGDKQHERTLHSCSNSQ